MRMSAESPQTFAAPIVEAILDVECDLPPGLDLAALAARARAAFADRYPVQQPSFEAPAEAPLAVPRSLLGSFQLFQEDKKQLVQVRARGYTFNRLAPYTSLDDYLPEIERTWRLFVDLAGPLQVRLVRLHYINRIVLPLTADAVDLAAYFTTAPARFPVDDTLRFAGFLAQQSAVERATGRRVKATLTSQPTEAAGLPVIFDIEAVAETAIEPRDWPAILAEIQSLRGLKNMTFRSTLTDRCLRLLQEETR